MSDRLRNIVVVVVVAVLLVYIGVQARSVNNRATKAQAATAQLAETLNRRSPVLDYLSCSDDRAIAVDATEKAFLLAMVDRNPNVAALRAAYVTAVDTRSNTRLPADQGGCGIFPNGG